MDNKLRRGAKLDLYPNPSNYLFIVDSLYEVGIRFLLKSSIYLVNYRLSFYLISLIFLKYQSKKWRLKKTIFYNDMYH